MLSAIGAHIYAGGFTVGVSKHFEVLAHLEHNAYGAEVVRLNFPGLPVHAGGPASWPKEWPKGARRPRFLYANPPCAIWSSAGGKHSEEWRSDPRLAVHHDIFRYATEDVGVDVLAIESVPPSFTRGRDHADALMAKAAGLGYSSTVVLHDARYLGVAQRRSRVFYVFHRVAVDWETPDFETDAQTVREVLKSLGRHRTKGFDPVVSMLHAARVELLRHAGPGEKLRQVYDRLHPDPVRGDRGQKVGSPSFLDQRVPWDKPAPVLIADKLYHPVEDRFLDQEELAAICSFPPGYLWPKASSGNVSGWMSRGVMPKVGEWLAANVARALERNRRVNEPRAEVLDITGPPGRLYPLTEKVTMPRVQVQTPAAKAAGPPPKTITGLPPRDPGEGSGAYIRRLLLLGAAPDAILERVHAQFPGSKATASDVAYNKGKLKKDGLWPANGAAPNGANGHAAPPAKAPKHGAPVPAKAAAPPWETPAKPAGKAAAIPDESLSYAVLRGRANALTRQTPTKLALVELAKVVTAALDAMEALQ